MTNPSQLSKIIAGAVFSQAVGTEVMLSLWVTLFALKPRIPNITVAVITCPRVVFLVISQLGLQL